METRRLTTSGIARPALLVGIAALGSRVLGFVRDMLMAWLLGGGPAADALVVALQLPHVLRRLLGEGSLSMTLTACFVHSRKQAVLLTTHDGRPAYFDPASANLALDIAWRIALFLGLGIILAEFAARPLISIIAPGLAAHPKTAWEATYLLRICLPYTLAAGMAALSMAFLHSLGHFLVPALSPACFNLTIITFALLAACGLGNPAIMLACGFLAGGLVQWLMQAVTVWRMGLWQHKKQCTPSAEVYACLRRLPAGLLGAAAPQLAMLCAMMAASFLPPGAMAALYYAERLLELPMSVTGTTLGMVSLPGLAALATAGRHDFFAQQCSTALRLSLLLALPATAGLLAVGNPLITVLLGHGAFDSVAVESTTLALYGYSLGLPVYALTRPLLAACNAQKATRMTAISGIAAVVGTLVCTFILFKLLPAEYAVLGPPLGVSAGLSIQGIILMCGLQNAMNRASQKLEQVLPHSSLYISAPALRSMITGSVLTLLCAHSLAECFTSPLLSLVSGISVGIAVYTFTLGCMGNEDFKAACTWCKKRCMRKPA